MKSYIAETRIESDQIKSNPLSNLQKLNSGTMNPAYVSQQNDKKKSISQNDLKQSSFNNKDSNNDSDSEFVYENNFMSQVNMEINNFVTISELLVKVLHRRDELVNLYNEVVDKESEYKSEYGFEKTIEFLNDEEKERHKLLLKLNTIK